MKGRRIITALDTRTGEKNGKSPKRDETRPGPRRWSSSTRANPKSSSTATIAREDTTLETGTEIWECGGQAANPIPSPVGVGDMAYCLTGFRGYAMFAIPLGSTGDITETDKIAWHHDKARPMSPRRWPWASGCITPRIGPES